MANKGRRYNAEFKSDIIRLIKEEGRSVNSVAKDLGVNAQTIHNWLGEQKTLRNPYKVKILELEAQLKTSNRRVADLEESVEILKKATAIFMTKPQN
jgi:transposase